MTASGAAGLSALHVLKGHGTGNDFVVIPDLDGTLELTDGVVRALCDRHTGLGADGVLRIVATELVPEFAASASRAPYFMDYRNADASIAEMCGNGVRVFARYLHRAGLVGDVTAVATRGGVKDVRIGSDETITVVMGKPHMLSATPAVSVAPELRGTGRALEIPNPHVVVALDSPDALRSLNLSSPPRVEPSLPHGQNVEFVAQLGERHIAMRVHERGVGETLSCGTGICAAVVASPGAGPDDQWWRVDIPGGTCTVRWRTDGEVELRGPAVLVAEVELDSDWLAEVSR